jgi:hypothetical protein
MKRVTSFIIRLLGSRAFFYGVLGFLIVESLWVAVSSLYPMAFDEEFHFGLIKIYSGHWLPFLSGQPEDAGAFGAVARDPSYLYHYLLSFPYRFTALFTDSQTIQVIVLRLINIGLLAFSIVLFRQVLRRAGTSLAFTHVALALFVLVPIVPLLGGQINYDNLLLPLLAWVCLLVADVIGQLRFRTVSVKTLAVLLSLCLVSSLVTHVFLPIMAVVCIFITALMVRSFWRRGVVFRKKLLASFSSLGIGSKIGLTMMLLVSVGLFVQRDVANVVMYGTPAPDCDQVIARSECVSYGPWQRNELLARQNDNSQLEDPLGYTAVWLTSLHFRSFFVVSGPANYYVNYPPLPLPSATAIVIVVSGMVALLLYWRRIFSGRPYLFFLCLATFGYCAVLWIEDYMQYRYTGHPVAINGRYLLIIMLPFAAVLGRALQVALRPIGWIQPWLAVLSIALFLQGGGVLSYISRSDPSWYWPERWIVGMNDTARRWLDPLLIESGKHY